MAGGFGYGGPEVPQQPEQWAPPQPSGWQPAFRQWQPFVALGRRATLATAGLVAAMAVQVVWIVMWMSLRSDVHRFAFEDEHTVLQQLDDAKRRLALIMPLDLLVAVVAGVLFIAWFHRAYKNLSALGAEGMRRSAGWAIGSWFIPVVSLVLPKKLANDLWRASDPEGPASHFNTWRARGIPSAYNWWWVFWLLSNFTFGVGLSMQNSAHGASQWLHGNDVTIAASVGLIVAAALAIWVVSATSRRQEARAEQLRSDRSPPPPYTATVWAGS